MNIATVIFTYTRFKHTNLVLEYLKKNTELPEHLIIFQDGIKDTTNINDWKSVNELINNVDWCPVETYVASSNKGLSDSIINGITNILKTYDAVIVLEDDCVPHPQFMEYMRKGLLKYKDYDEVYSINAYDYPLNIEKNGTSAYFTGRIESWGWGTWKNKWAVFDRDYRLLSKIKKDEELNKRFHNWGEDLESYLYGNVSGVCNSWAVFWALNVIWHRGVCVTPYGSFIDNTGFDGSGVNCGKNNIVQNIRSFDYFENITFPDHVEFPSNAELLYRNYWKWTSPQVKLQCYNKTLQNFVPLANKGIISNYLIEHKYLKIAIWGKGKLTELFIREIYDDIDVKCIIETSPSVSEWGEWNLPVVNIDCVTDNLDLIIVIPSYDIDRICLYVKENLKSYSKLQLISLDELLNVCTESLI